MFGRHKTAILKVTSLLRRLETSREDLTLLVAIQGELIRRIVRTERRIVTTRAKKVEQQRTLRTKRLPKLESKKLRRQIAGLDDRLGGYQQLAFIWRCFGDGMAFAYLDKFALKHAYLNTHDLEPKQGAGALSGKDGLINERKVVRALCAKSMSAMLCDVTNILRHGDVCLLVGPDPFLIEVKSSSNRNARAVRQLGQLERLHTFYKNDSIENFRGLSGVVARQAFKTPEVTYIDELNYCIDRSRRTGYAQVSPEEGLHYICLRGTGAVEALEEQASKDCIVIFLNERKTAAQWPPYYPFTLSIRSPESLFDFIVGEYSLVISVHGPTFLDHFKRLGLTAEWIDDENYAIELGRPGAVVGRDPICRLSRQLFARIFYEFQSLRWFAQIQFEGFEEIERAGLQAAANGGLGHPRPSSTSRDPLHELGLPWPTSND